MPLKRATPDFTIRSTDSVPEQTGRLNPTDGRPSAAQRPEKEWPQPHGRYLSEWRDDIVRVNVSHQRAAPEAVSYDLTNIVVAVNGGLSPFTTHRRLGDFPEFVDTLKILINLTCKRHHRGNVEPAITAAIATAVRLFIWMHRKGAPALRALTSEDVNALVVDVAEKGWWSILEYDEALKVLLERASEDLELRESLRSASSAKHHREGNFKRDIFATELGLPYAPHLTPTWFARDFGRLVGIPEDQIKPRAGGLLKNKKTTMHTLNLLAEMPAGFDGLSRYPFANVSRSQRSLNITSASNRDGRTENLDLDVAVTIFRNSIKWVYDYFPGIIELVAAARDELEKNVSKEPWTTLRRLRLRLRKEYPGIKAKFHLPFPTIDASEGEFSLARMIDYLFVAATSLIASNHGRRRNEVNGFEKPYGLYFGCVEQVAAEPELRRIDFYIEKSLKDYATFWCNKLVADVVERLEQLQQYFRPLNTNPIDIERDHEAGRNIKLFSRRTFSQHGFSAAATEFDWESHARQFFALCGMSTLDFSGRAHPFRRIFCLLFVNRYDHPELIALSEHLGHVDIDQTQVYITDPPARRLERRIAMLIGKARDEMKDFYQMLQDVRSEAFEQKILDLLSGKLIGGGLPRLILKFIKRMSASATFRKMSLEDQARLTRERMEAHAYRYQESRNGGCSAGNARHTRKAAKCAADGQIHHERANPETCHGCIHSLTTENYITLMEQDAAELRAASENPRTPPSLRLRWAKDAERLFEIARQERQLGEKSRALMLSVVQGFTKVYPIAEVSHASSQ
ncbi:hypothetical protein [Paraburkholderia aromaticivorans]|uniref:Tyr recombinase domain-containing protein n=1 Tax=Paraburkholderia aromaticivorans TaxID=2026199 RepID=A0A248VE24_9BURK|nr:hypothetical protein [Paraburkholderia aromaticivorans]ASV96709.1 hypothetical protein CJU94_00055 [Paraburkholderia aromaticivorans]